MKNFLIGIFVLLLPCYLWGEDESFRILYLNTSHIMIGGKTMAVGDEFNSKDAIKWTSERQALRVVSLLTNRQFTLTSSSMSKRKSLAEFIMSEKNLATRPGLPASLPSVSLSIPDTIYLLDKWEFQTSVPIDSNHFFYASYLKNGEVVNKRLPPIIDEGFLIDRTLWHIDGVSYAPCSMPISLHYYDMEHGIVTTVIDELMIFPLDL